MGRNARNQIIEVSDVDNIVMELNEGNVQAIFNRCLAKEGGPKEHVKNGFDVNELIANIAQIKYMSGQLLCVHQAKSCVLMGKELCKGYRGTEWTDSVNFAYKLLNMAIALDLIVYDGKETITLDMMVPTLSTKDPNFGEWYAKEGTYFLRICEQQQKYARLILNYKSISAVEKEELWKNTDRLSTAQIKRITALEKM